MFTTASDVITAEMRDLFVSFFHEMQIAQVQKVMIKRVLSCGAFGGGC
jgi:hypothetical protein